MKPITFFLVYIAIFVACAALTIGIIRLLSPGIKKYFISIFQDDETADFFLKMVRLVLFMSGLSAALSSKYTMDEKSNWLTLSWEATGQFQSTLSNLYNGMMAFTFVFLVLHLFNKLLAK